MKILFVSALLPYPPHQGGQVRMYNLLKKLALHHDITLLSFIRVEEEKEYLKKLDFCRRVIPIWRGNAWQPQYVFKSFLGNKPFLYATYDNDQMRQTVAQEVTRDSYDLIHLEPSYVWPSLPVVNLPVVVTEHNIESSIYQGYVVRYRLPFVRPFLYWDVLKLRWWERRVWKKASHIVAVSETDADVIRNTTKAARVSVVPNGVDLSQFTFQPKKKPGKKILFVGYFGWLQNRDALGYILDVLWPKIIKSQQGMSLRVIGKKLPKNLREKITSLGGSYGEEVEDIVVEYHKADCLLAPIRIGGGTRYKILEAMATGLPVVTTTIGAQGLAVSSNKELFVADRSDDIVKAVSEALANTKLRREMTKRARAVVEKNYSWDQLAKKLERVWNNVKKTS
ncbi:glycosyltransferase [Candidatus Gottesmanbacteria bacterium]|nr:glycosyltransferase [Candidatus Gottesmanbacteria bacterium]